jgi:hypothetical protein
VHVHMRPVPSMGAWHTSKTLAGHRKVLPTWQDTEHPLSGHETRRCGPCSPETPQGAPSSSRGERDRPLEVLGRPFRVAVSRGAREQTRAPEAMQLVLGDALAVPAKANAASSASVGPTHAALTTPA